MNNPFKFGSIVDAPYFINRQDEIDRVKSYLATENHLIIISPRRFGKSSLINKVLKDLDRPFLLLDLQLITTATDFAAQILIITRSHPYFTQQLAFYVWELLNRNENLKEPVEKACEEIIINHDIDYERLWNTLNRTDMKILIGMAFSEASPLSSEFSTTYFNGPTSTIFSSLKRLTRNGLLINTTSGYEIDDPLFKRWIIKRRQR